MDNSPHFLAKVSYRILLLRSENKMTQAQLAKKLHTSQQTVSRLESFGYKGHSVKTLDKIAKIFNKRLAIQFEERQ